MKYNKENFFKNIVVILISSFILIFSYGIAYAATSFSFSVPEGQGGFSNEFYHGRCVRADVMLDTDGNNTGGADLEINYDNSRITIVNSDCSTSATTIYHESQYNAYTNNHVTTSKITLGAYNNPGNIYNGSGRFASFYFIVLDGIGDYDLDFEFTLGDTTDTNLAEFGTGNEILDQADSYTLHFTDDIDIPYINNENPASGSNGVQVTSNILYRLNDDSAGINFSTLTQSLTGVNWGITNYTSVSGQILHNCVITNANRVPHCDIILNPTNNLYYCENYAVDTTVSDLGNPTIHTLNNHIYNFDTEDDNDATTLYNLSPGNGSGGNSTTANIDFNIQDVAIPGAYPGTGVDISTLIVDVSVPIWGSQTYTTASPELSSMPVSINDYGNVYDYNISINPTIEFPENTLVTVRVRADDYGCPSINSMDYTYTFTTSDTEAPVCDQFSPNQNAVNLGVSDDITFRCIDDGVGIDINSMDVVVNGITYTSSGINQFNYTGNPTEYFITVDPSSDFLDDYALEAIINGEDFSHNQISQISYGLATGTDCGSSSGGGAVGGGTQFVCKDPKALNYSNIKYGKHKESLCIYNDCSICSNTSDVTNDVITKYKTCKIVKNFNSINFLSSESKIPNTTLGKILLKKINSNNIDSILITVTGDSLIFEGSAIPNTTVTLMIESEPIIVTGLTDSDGNWKIEIINLLKDGVHSISAISLSEDNYILNTKHLTDFVVKRHNYFRWWFWIILFILFIITTISYRKYKIAKNKLIKLEKQKTK